MAAVLWPGAASAQAATPSFASWPIIFIWHEACMSRNQQATHFEEGIEDILSFWFGHVEQTIVPSEERARIWFGESSTIDAEIKRRFSRYLTAAQSTALESYVHTPRGQLALIILLDQCSRHIYRNTPQAYEQDEQALAICLSGIDKEDDHKLSLIERVFFYYPLLHSEQLIYQQQSLQAYQKLAHLAFAETQSVYSSFLSFSKHHYAVIHQFGRFPQRNKILGRTSTPGELAYLAKIQQQSG